MVSTYEDNFGGTSVGLLQELCVSRSWLPPTYQTEHEEGLPHDRQFTIACVVLNFKEIGTGKSKKLAKRQAANKMWNKLKNINVVPPQTFSDNSNDTSIASDIGSVVNGVNASVESKDKKAEVIISPKHKKEESQPLKPVSEVLQSYPHKGEESKKNTFQDEALSSFFKEIEETVRGFPLSVKIETIKAIDAIINSLELKTYKKPLSSESKPPAPGYSICSSSTSPLSPLHQEQEGFTPGYSGTSANVPSQGHNGNVEALNTAIEHLFI